MTLYAARSIPWMLLLLAACSASSPTAATAKGAPRAPGLTAASDIGASVRQLTARGSDSLEVTAGPLPNSKVIRIRGGFSEVLLAKTNPDGTVSTRCVDSPGGGDAFLNSAGPSAPVKAAQ